MRREEPLPQLITHSSTVMGTNKDSGSVGVSHTSYVLFSRGGPESLHGRGSKAKKMPTLLPQQYSFSLPPSPLSQVIAKPLCELWLLQTVRESCEGGDNVSPGIAECWHRAGDCQGKKIKNKKSLVSFSCQTHGNHPGILPPSSPPVLAAPFLAVRHKQTLH